MTGAPSGFEFAVRGDRVGIRHNGVPAATLRRGAAAAFLDAIERRDPQHVMARVTGNYTRGNENSSLGVALDQLRIRKRVLPDAPFAAPAARPPDALRETRMRR